MNLQTTSAAHKDTAILQQLVEQSPHGVVLTDENGGIRLWNPALERTTGVPDDETVGCPLWDVLYRLMPEADRTDAVYEDFERTGKEFLTHGTGPWAEAPSKHWIERRDGEKRILQVTFLALSVGSGFQIAGILRDVTLEFVGHKQLKVLTQAVEQSPVTVVVTDQNGLIEYGNSRLTELTGYTVDEVQGKTPRIFKSGMTPATVYENLWETISSGQSWHGELQNRKKNGEVFWERISISPVLDPQGAIQHFVAIKEDITEKRAAEQAVRESEERFRATFEQAAVGIAHVAPDGRFLRINRRFCDLVGYTHQEMLSKSFQAITYPNDLDTDLHHVERMLKHEIDHYSLEKRYICKDGTIKWVELTVSLTWNSDGSPKYFISVVQDISKRKNAERALRDSEERFRTLVSSTDDVIFTLDSEQRHTGVYGRWLNSNPLTIEDFLGKTARDIFGDAAAQIHEEANQRALAGQSVIYEWSTGEQFYQTSLAPLHDETNQVIGVVGIGREITALKQAEAQIREAERFARSTMDSLSTEIAILDSSGVILQVNETWRVFARNNAINLAALCEGANYVDVLNAVSRDSEDHTSAQAFLMGIEAVITGKQDTFSLEYPCHSPTEKRWFIGSITRFVGEGPLRLVIAHEDITERKLAEISIQRANLELERLHTALHQQNESLEQIVNERTAQFRHLNRRLTTILNTTNDAILLLNEDGSIESANVSFGRLFSYERKEILGKPLRFLADDETGERLSKALMMLRQQGKIHNIQITAVRKDASIFDADVSLAVVRGNAKHVVCSVRDITQLKEVERAKDALISMVSHELRTPIASLTLSTETLVTYYQRTSDEKRLQKLQQIHQQAAILTELVTSILDIARFDAQKSHASFSKVDLQQVTEAVVSELKPQAENKGLNIELSVQAEITIQANSMDITRIWRNLIGNAVKYCDAGNTIRVHQFLYHTNTLPETISFEDISLFHARIFQSGETDTYIVGIVEDNGPGIRAEDTLQLFTRFFRGWAAQTEVPGTGLGLALVKEIVQMYRGDIAVHSVFGKGATFCFWLPMKS